ncbi:hypothetical protein DS2_12669 [Catenovulum agarivorans DS-2]|uniref:Uncharacterized protein n=1 Tax=Catenovulum agarivorans DS-2 TaxID=1328313 RepID=W7QNA8_9ALTE|nr:hypothetical protein [Catenovulum agarivorans]EWH09388.1 hypothetical protein DS2_12669 [Catenovulum agarivorans DS-2]
MTWVVNKWVRYLEGYCQGQNQIQDEYVRKVASNLGLEQPLNIKFEWQKQITQQFESKGSHGVIILTGTAGDGKTKLCRDIVKQIEGESFNEDNWNSKSFFRSNEKTIVKDFSELSPENTSVIITELINVLRSGFSSKPILIAVNDGILVDEIDKFITPNNDYDLIGKAKQLKEIIEDKINLGFSSCHQQELIKLVNLSKLNAKENFSLIIDEILNHSGWSSCDSCEGKQSNTCPIYQKYNLLKSNPHIKENLSNIILLLQLNNEHFTIRELLNLATNTILASTPKAKHLKATKKETNYQIFTCNRVKRLNDREGLNYESSIEVGFWGMNLGPHKMHNARPYSEINKLNFGELSTNYWDNLLKHKDSRDIEIPLDDFNELLSSKKTLESGLNPELWGAIVRRSRMQLYCYQKNDTRSYELQKYSSFTYFKSNVYQNLLGKDVCDDIELISLIVLALNRVFHGRYISEETGKDRLYVPEKDQGSITPISIFHGDDIRDRDIFISKVKGDFELTGSRIEPVIEFYVDRDIALKLTLTVELFDFLYQIAKGSPPNTTNPRLYKKLLIFRSKLASQISKNSRASGKRIDTYTINSGEFRPSALKVNHG